MIPSLLLFNPYSSQQAFSATAKKPAPAEPKMTKQPSQQSPFDSINAVFSLVGIHQGPIGRRKNVYQISDRKSWFPNKKIALEYTYRQLLSNREAIRETTSSLQETIKCLQIAKERYGPNQRYQPRNIEPTAARIINSAYRNGSRTYPRVLLQQEIKRLEASLSEARKKLSAIDAALSQREIQRVAKTLSQGSNLRSLGKVHPLYFEISA